MCPPTFSPMTQVGWSSLTSLKYSGQRCLGSCSPFLSPATEKGWQGYPPVMMSMLLIPSALVNLIPLRHHRPVHLKMLFKFFDSSSKSQNVTVSTNPADSNLN